MKKDRETSIEDLKNKVKSFCDSRDWDQFYDAKELAIALSIEASEILEHFRWKKSEEIQEMLKNPVKREEISDELSDVFYFLLRIAQMNDIDLTESFERKLKKNEKKYPIDKAKGSSKKYNEFE